MTKQLTGQPVACFFSSLSKVALTLCACVVLSACGDSNNSNVLKNNGGGQSGNASPSTNERCSIVDNIPADQHMVTGWRTAPTDALITHPITALTVRQFFAPHRDGEVIRLQLSNRYSGLPVTLENIYIAREDTPGLADLVPDSECLLTFDGESRITIPAGETVITDAIAYPVRSFERVGISFYAPEATPQITRHLGADEILYMSYPGDYTTDPTGAMFQPVPDGYASNFLAIEALEVNAPDQVTSLVTVGDSITDGSGSTTEFMTGEPARMTSTDQRYPNHLQRRINEAGLPITVANAGIGGNELLNNGWLPQFGVNLLNRFDYDVLAVTAATHVLVMIGTNDFGNPKAGGAPSPEDMITGFIELIDRTHAAGIKITLGTIPPAEGAVFDSLPVFSDLPVGVDVMHGTPEARASRDAVNAWIREQQLSDGIVDFDACLEDPENPGYLAPEYNSGDNLHPSPAGYAAMAECVNLDLFHAAGNP